MTNTKLYDYLQGMTVYEMNRFNKYIQSPLYNEDEKLKDFVSALLPHAKRKSLENFKYKSPQAVKNYNRLLSDTVKKLERFLIIDRFQQRSVLQHIYLQEIMNERGLHKHFPEFASLTQKRHAQSTYRDAEYYHRDFLLQEQRNLYLENKAERSTDKNLQQVLESLDVFYFITKLKYFAALLHYQNFLSVEADLILFKDILKETSDKKYNNIISLQLHRNIVLLYIPEQAKTAYKKLKSLLMQSKLPVPEQEVKTAFAFAVNYCISQINFGKQQFLNELLSLYKHALVNGLLVENGILSQWDYKNITTVALRAKEFKWAEKFLEEHKIQLPKTERKNACAFNMARYFFYVRDYNRVLQLLQQVEYNDIFYQLDAKTTLLKTYYELGEWQPLYSLKDSFRILLRRKKLITEEQKENYMNLLRFTLRLFNCDVKNKKEMAELKRDLTTSQNVADKSWLIEKLQELM